MGKAVARKRKLCAKFVEFVGNTRNCRIFINNSKFLSWKAKYRLQQSFVFVILAAFLSPIAKNQSIKHDDMMANKLTLCCRNGWGDLSFEPRHPLQPAFPILKIVCSLTIFACKIKSLMVQTDRLSCAGVKQTRVHSASAVGSSLIIDKLIWQFRGNAFND